MFFNEDHLKITKPKTADGRTPLIDPKTERTVTKVIFAPSNPITKKLFEEENTRLPNGLKMKIEHVKGYIPQPIVNHEVSKNTELQEENEKLKAELEALKKLSQNGNSLNGEPKETSKDNSQVVNTQQNVKNEKK